MFYNCLRIQVKVLNIHVKSDERLSLIMYAFCCSLYNDSISDLFITNTHHFRHFAREILKQIENMSALQQT